MISGTSFYLLTVISSLKSAYRRKMTEASFLNKPPRPEEESKHGRWKLVRSNYEDGKDLLQNFRITAVLLLIKF